MEVFLDLWGVLTDSRRMTPAYRERLAVILEERYGGTAGAWQRAHDLASAWFEDHMDRPETWTHGTWRETVDRAEAEGLVRTFGHVGIEPPANPVVAVKALEFEVMCAIDAAFPDARPAVARLKAEGHRAYVSTNATESNARGALTGARLLSAFDGVFTGELLNAGKATRDYWETIRDRYGMTPSRALVVDDRLKYLEAAAAVGFPTALLDREDKHPADAVPPHVPAVLRNLAGLPHYVALVAKGGGR